jgi:Apea-like HEPN
VADKEHTGEDPEKATQQAREEPEDPGKDIWPDPRASGRPPVVVAVWAKFQFIKAEHQSRRRLQEFINLGLFLEPDPESLKIYLVRGNRNRPGLRGLVLDRGAVGAGLAGTPWTRELGAETLIASRFGIRPMGSWYSTEPIPLDRLLAPKHRRIQISSLLDVDTPLTRRFTIASRWYAEAYWAEETVDAVLALGIALDTLIGDPNGLPLRATSERFALLEPDSQLRSQRARRYQDIFSVRSAIAHGSISRRAESRQFLSDMASDVRWAARRILALRDRFSPTSQDDIRQVFDELRWGTLSWN